MANKKKQELVDIPFDGFVDYVGIQKAAFMRAAGMSKQRYRQIKGSPENIFVRYNKKTGEFSICRPEKEIGSGSILNA